MKKKTYNVIMHHSSGRGVTTINSHAKNFHPDFMPCELACPREPIMKFHHSEQYGGFVNWLGALRQKVGKPFIINSACRTPAHNKAVGGHPRSLHLTAPLQGAWL